MAFAAMPVPYAFRGVFYGLMNLFCLSAHRAQKDAVFIPVAVVDEIT